MRILITCVNFNSFTGSELYVYELSRGLIERGFDVSVASNFGGDIALKAMNNGVKLYQLNNLPDVEFDLLHINQGLVCKHVVTKYVNTPIVCGIHSELISLEAPIFNDMIKKYIAIRPKIKEHLINQYGVPDELITVIYNPIDDKRFNLDNQENKINEKKIVLFVGSIHTLREPMLVSLIKKTHDDGNMLWIVGKEHGVLVKNLAKGYEHVKHFPQTWDVDKYFKGCDETAGILLGRTTIEGWLCGKPGWVYDINKDGKINSFSLEPIPYDVDKFKCSLVVDDIIKIYKETFNA